MTEREPTKPTLDDPGSELVPRQRGPAPDRTSPSRTEREFHTLRTWAGAGPEAELPSQPGPEPEPDVASPSRTEREPTKPMLDDPGSELVPRQDGQGGAGSHLRGSA